MITDEQIIATLERVLEYQYDGVWRRGSVQTFVDCGPLHQVGKTLISSHAPISALKAMRGKNPHLENLEGMPSNRAIDAAPDDADFIMTLEDSVTNDNHTVYHYSALRQVPAPT
jgi:hypothetical protein